MTTATRILSVALILALTAGSALACPSGVDDCDTPPPPVEIELLAQCDDGPGCDTPPPPVEIERLLA